MRAVGEPAGRLPVLVLSGPTGSGKTDWAIALARAAPVEIVSVDSALVYRGLDIGTAKPPARLRALIPHHLVDICEPTESYSAGRFVADALAAIEKNFSTNKIRPATDKDVPCQGKTGHEIDFAVGPEGHQLIIHRVIVPDGTGIDTVTYARADGTVFDPDVKKSEDAYCAESGS